MDSMYPNPVLQQLNKSNALLPVPNLEQVKEIYQTIKNSKNPKSLIDYYAAADPEFKEVMDFMGQNGGSLKDAFYAMAKRKGIDPDEIISPLKNNRW